MTSLLHAFSHVEQVDSAALQSDAGRAWIDGLTQLADALCGEWGLGAEHDHPRIGYHAVVIPVRRNDTDLVLKLAWPPESVRDEQLALAAWEGRGTALLYESDVPRGALVLERLDAEQPLSRLPVEAAVQEAGLLLRRMAIPAPEGLPSGRDHARAVARRISTGKRHPGYAPEDWVELGAACAEAASEVCGTTLVHTDLHFENILRGDRLPWVAIDPKPIAGDPEQAVPELFWTRVDELFGSADIRRLLGLLVDAAEPDSDKAARWGFARTLDYWLWGLQHGLTVDPPRCHRVAEALLPLVAHG